jgi:hypothetical protein
VSEPTGKPPGCRRNRSHYSRVLPGSSCDSWRVDFRHQPDRCVHHQVRVNRTVFGFGSVQFIADSDELVDDVADSAIARFPFVCSVGDDPH